MSKIKLNCGFCGGELLRWKSQIVGEKSYCDKSCQRKHRNIIDNPSSHRDLSGSNNPMYGRHPVAWNKGMKGEKCFNWKGGLRKRKDGYFRINIDGERHLYHRWLLGLKHFDGRVVHHRDHNPSNNEVENLMIFENQSDHVKYESRTRIAPNTSNSCEGHP